MIASDQWIDFAYFDREGFLIGQWLQSTRLDDFCLMHRRYYPHLIREFYGSLARGEDRWAAIVRGSMILVSDEMLSRVWETPHHGIIANGLGDKEVGFICILEKDDVQGISTLVSMETRLLHHIMAWILLLKTGQFDFIIEWELMLMVVIVQWIAINLLATWPADKGGNYQ